MEMRLVSSAVQVKVIGSNLLRGIGFTSSFIPLDKKRKRNWANVRN
jgi:hypothetical protein